MRILVNHSNHLSEKWSPEQKRGWDIILDIPFPNIPATATSSEVRFMAEQSVLQILSLLEPYKYHNIYISVLGEYSYSYYFVCEVKRRAPHIKIAVPTTERSVIEKIKEDGSVEKTAIFKFVQWRYVY